MKKVVFAAIILMGVSFTACQGEKKAETTEATEATETVEPVATTPVEVAPTDSLQTVATPDSLKNDSLKIAA
ncbi:MAG: hypothetical protein Q4F97_11015 [Bacteroidales bacterium]|nr:hypothetical protein [Bacteroidales bacterium]